MLEHAKLTKNCDDVIETQADVETFKAWTPLFFAIASGPNGHPEIVNLLLRNGADANARD